MKSEKHFKSSKKLDSYPEKRWFLLCDLFLPGLALSGILLLSRTPRGRSYQCMGPPHEKDRDMTAWRLQKLDSRLEGSSSQRAAGRARRDCSDLEVSAVPRTGSGPRGQGARGTSPHPDWSRALFSPLPTCFLVCSHTNQIRTR